MAIKTLSLMWQWQNWRDEQNKLVVSGESILDLDIDRAKDILAQAKNSWQKNLDSFAADEVMISAGIQTPPTTPVDGLTKARRFADENGWPIVLKISSSGLLHKSDLGGVITHIKTPDDLNIAGKKLTEKINSLDPESKKGARIQIQKEIQGGIEVIVGVKRDPNFGPVMLFGAGGKFTIYNCKLLVSLYENLFHFLDLLLKINLVIKGLLHFLFIHYILF